MLPKNTLIFRSKFNKLPGSNYKEVYKNARQVYSPIEKKTKRQPYLRSAYFKKQKVFFTYFWKHISDKQFRDRVRRLKYLACALELIENSKIPPTIKPNPNRKSELLYRFYGKTKDGDAFYVQIKEEIKKKRLNFISIFPETNQ